MPTMLSPRLMIAFLSGTGSKNFGVQREREVGVLPSPDRLSKDHFSSFFSSN